MHPPAQMIAYDAMEITAEGYRPYEDSGFSDEDYQEFMVEYDRCPHCSCRLLIVVGDESWETRGMCAGRDYRLWHCRNCRFWQSRIVSDLDGQCMPGPSTGAYVAKLRGFDPALPGDCHTELAQHIRRNPHYLNRCSPVHLEKLVAEVMRYNYADAEVVHVGRPDDGGVDVLLVDGEHNQWLIQVKRREAASRVEGVETIRTMVGTMFLEGVPRGIVVSTGERFSLRARQAAVRAMDKGMTVRLVDRGILNKMLDPLLPDRPWLGPVEKLDPELASFLGRLVDSDYQLTLFPEFECGRYRIVRHMEND